MQVEISIPQYLSLEGDLNKIDISKTRCDYSDKNFGKEIIAVTNKGEMNQSREMLLDISFSDGTTHRYAALWIKTKVEMVLDDKFLIDIRNF